MIKEKNPLIDLKLSKKESNFNKLYKTSSETFYLLFDLILEDPIENIWFELINIFSGYLQLLMYLLDPTLYGFDQSPLQSPNPCITFKFKKIIKI